MLYKTLQSVDSVKWEEHEEQCVCEESSATLCVFSFERVVFFYDAQPV